MTQFDPSKDSVARFIDHTLLKPDATQEQIETLCQEAAQYQFASVCVNPTYVQQAAEALKDTTVKVCTVVGFPLGAATAVTKAFETQQAAQDGATEIDMVINIGALKSQDYQTVIDDIKAVVEVAHIHQATVKVIIEAALLTDDEKTTACILTKAAGADYVKTSTGFSSGGATVSDVKLMRRAVGPNFGVKAAGGIRTYDDAKAMIDSGATRLGASAGVAIMAQEQKEKENNK